MASKTAQKNLTSQFMSITGVNEKSAMRYLKASSWKLEQACDSGGNTSDMDKDQKAFYRTPNIIISDSRNVHEDHLEDTILLADVQSNHESVLWDATLDEIERGTTASSMHEPAQTLSSLGSSRKHTIWRSGPLSHVTINTSNWRVDTYRGIPSAPGHGGDLCRTLTPSPRGMASMVPGTEQSNVRNRKRGVDSHRPPLIRPSANQSIRNSSNRRIVSNFVESDAGLSIMASTSSTYSEPHQPLPSHEIRPKANEGTRPEAKNEVLPKVKQNADSKATSYFAQNGSAPLAKERDTLDKLFEKYREESDDKDKTGVNGTMRYLQDLGLNLENAEMFVPLEIVQAPALAEMSKDGFVEGWKAIGADTIPKQKAYVAGQLKQLSIDMALFKKVYRHTFVCSREAGQKALPLDNALVYWEMIFNPPGKPWVTASTNWTALWIEFLRANWTKTVNKDMWNQTFEFFQKTMQDETLSFWSEDGAWPGVIDEFVAYAKERRGDLPDTMETD